MKQIDLNSDLGESFGAYTIGNDSEVLRWVSSANVACGMHAGDPFVMHRTVRLALERGAAIGAHPGLMDLPGFGRRTIPTKPEEAYDLVAYQLGALSAFVKAEGGRLQHVKPHGALYNMAAKDPALAEAIAGAVYDVDPSLVLYGLAGSCLIRAAEKAGLASASEVFADRTYQDDGSLTPRSQPGAVLTDDEAAISQVLRMIGDGTVISVSGKEVPVRADTVCIHGDSPKALDFARRIRERLTAEGIEIISFIAR